MVLDFSSKGSGISRHPGYKLNILFILYIIVENTLHNLAVTCVLLKKASKLPDYLSRKVAAPDNFPK